MQTSFYAMLSRMKYINRWGLMRNNRPENLSEHSLEVALIAHALAIIRNRRFGGTVNPEHAALLGIYHDAHEIITGDLPTPVKYLNPEIKGAYKKVEASASRQLLSMLPQDLLPDYEPLVLPDENEAECHALVKAADKLSALIKCVEEERAGNTEFSSAKAATIKALKAMALPEVEVFLTECIPAYSLTLDELNKL